LTSRDLRPLAALAMVTLTSLISAGCGSGAPSETGTTSSTSTTASTGTNKSATGQDKAVKFAECIRSNGVSDFPDPDAKGEFNYGVSVSPAVWQKAVNTCKDLQPPGSLSAKRSPKQQTASLRFARCIRANGVKDFPDPANGEPVIDTTHIPSSNRPGGMTILNAAIQKCRSAMDEAVSGR
jgi:hypothetical protein